MSFIGLLKIGDIGPVHKDNEAALDGLSIGFRLFFTLPSLHTSRFAAFAAADQH